MSTRGTRQIVAVGVLLVCGGAVQAQGLKGEYFTNMDLQGAPAFTRIDERLDFDWGDAGHGISELGTTRIYWRSTAGATGPAPGHDYKFILLPVSHKLSESPEDFANRADRLTDEELVYLIDLILHGEEDVRSLAEGDYEALVEMIEKRLPEKAKELKDI